jgi:hypothetical protein
MVVEKRNFDTKITQAASKKLQSCTNLIRSCDDSTDGSPIQSSDCIKYLGLHIQANMRRDRHITYVINRASRILGLIRSVLYEAPTEVKRLAYYSLCRPLLEYASEVWDPYTNKHIHDLEMVQNKAVRFVYNVKGRDTSITDIKNQNHITALNVRRRDKRIEMMLNIIENEHLHPSLSTVLTDMLSKSSMSTRHQFFNSIYCRTNTFLYSFLPRTARELRSGGEVAE